MFYEDTPAKMVVASIGEKSPFLCQLKGLKTREPFLLPRLPNPFDATNVEITAYALVTYVGRQELFVEPIVKWFNTHRLTDGGWASTQDTIIATPVIRIDF